MENESSFHVMYQSQFKKINLITGSGVQGTE